MTRTPAIREALDGVKAGARSTGRTLVHALPRIVYALPLPLAIVGLILAFTDAWLLGLALVLLAYLGTFPSSQAALRIRIRRVEARIRRLERLLDATPGQPEPIPAVRAAQRWATSALRQHASSKPE